MSYVNVQVAEFEKAQSAILQVTHISRDEYSEMLFNHGTMFAEHFCRTMLNRDDMSTKLLQDYSWGFWPWFELKYKADDLLLVNNDFLTISAPCKDQYIQMKDCLIGDELLENDLYHFISAHL